MVILHSHSVGGSKNEIGLQWGSERTAGSNYKRKSQTESALCSTAGTKTAAIKRSLSPNVTLIARDG